MIHFVSPRYSFSSKALLKAFWMTFAFVILNVSLLGQEKIDYRGAWAIETPDNGELVLIVKRNGLASYFWAENTDCTVYQGSWSSNADGATLTWPDGSTHRITLNLLNYKVTYLNAAQDVLYTAEAKKLPEEVLGQWAKGPESPEDEISDRDKAGGFFGTWQIASESKPYYLIIEPDRSAATNWTPTPEYSNGHGLRGSWAKQGSELHIVWDTGNYGILKQNEKGFSFRLVPPGEIIEKNQSKELTATRIDEDSLPDEWRTTYLDERKNKTGGVAFTDRKEASQFYRGSWIVQRAENKFERIEIGRFGGLKTSADSTLFGNWRMSGQDIFMNWDDGMRKILSPIGNGFVLYEYKSGRPIDGVPSRIFSATPENAGKLAEHMKGRDEVARKLLSLAENAGVVSDVADTGWGQTFMRWVWPSGDQDKANESPEALLKAGLESSENLDPWWWPLWSESSTVENDEPDGKHNTDNTVEIVVNAESAKDNAETTGSASRTQTSESPKPDWYWPF